MRSLLLFPLALLLSCQPDTVSKQDTTGANAADADADGHASIDDGGDDCDDNNARVYPGATETPYDGLDQDCDGADLNDVDGDGFAAIKAGGDDCDDIDPKVYPDAGETPYDGLDQDCDGQDLVDVDGDSHAAIEAGGDDCDDADASIYPGAKETWYDGIDQDCNSNDCDSDFDGHFSALCGGGDCDDAESTIYPGATEVPYDSIDQDCDGLDLVDVDGDGYVAMVAGGDDCDDTEASAHPGGVESRGDEVDNDCDGRVDEYVVCADASGDFATIQEGVDGTPDGGTIEICPGVYAERVDIEDRVLTIEGAGETPEDVMMDCTGGDEGIWFSGVTGDISLKRMGFAGDDYQDEMVIENDNGSNLLLENLYFGGLKGCGAGCVGLGGGVAEYGHSIVFEKSYIVSCGRTLRDRILVGVATGDTVEVASNVFSGGLLSYIGMNAHGLLSIHNNIFLGGTQLLDIYSRDDVSMSRGNVRITNNTFTDLDQFRLFNTVWCPCSTGTEPPSVVVESNIFYNIGEWYTYELTAAVLWQVLRYDYGCFEFPPLEEPTFERNLLWNVPDGLWQIEDAVSTYSEDYSVVYDYFSDDMLAASIVADPHFEYPTDHSAYMPSAKSPCIDSGSGDPDPDGSPNDIGAFGGPDGDWWMEFPWPIP